MKYFLPLILCFTLLHLGKAQNCDNIGFDNGTFDGWEAKIGIIDESGNVNYGIAVDPSRYSNRFSLVRYQDIDPISLLKCASPTPNKNVESLYSVKLGNSQTGSQAEKLIKRLMVSETTALLIYRFSVLLEDPDHSEEEQPKFQITVKDKAGNVLPCGLVEYTAAGNLPGFQNCDDNTKVRDWNSAAIDLTPYIGEEIVLEFETRDCAKSGHFGYAYFDVECAPLAYTPLDYCEGEAVPDSVIINVPSGFSSYLWDNGTTNDYKVVYDPLSGLTHQVTMSSDNGCSVTIKSEILPNRIRPKLYASDTMLCNGEIVDLTLLGDDIYYILTANRVDTIFNNQYSFNYNGEQSKLFYAVGPGRCFLDSVLYTFTSIEPPVFSVPDSLIECGNTFSDIEITAALDNYTVKWSNGQTDYATRYNMRTISNKESVTVKAHPNCKTEFVEEFGIRALPIPDIELEFGLRDSCPPLQSFVIDKTERIKASVIGLNEWKYSIPRPTSNVLNFELNQSGDYTLHYSGSTDDACYVDTIIENAFTVYPHTPVVLSADRVELGDSLDLWSISDVTTATYALNRTWNSPSGIQHELERNILVQLNNTITTERRIELVRVNEFGCTDSSTIDVNAFSHSLFTPTAFSPNNDGDNDTYLPMCHNCIKEESVYKVVNRWGEMVFEGDFTQPWNGLNNEGKIVDKGQYTVQIIAKYIDIYSEKISAPLFILR